VLEPWGPRAILDLATGSGDLALTLRAHFPEARIVGTDFCYPMLARARSKGLTSLVAADALRLPFAGSVFDAVTVAFGLRNMSSWPLALQEMRRVLKPGGHVLLLDFSIPPRPWRGPYRAYLHHCLPRLAGWLTGERTAYEYLADSIERFPAGGAMRQLLEENGFDAATSERLTTGIVSLYTGRRG
jgi:demethylmenaquinone methyltransferase/2-methoxy-6-polyprenyl-1,4-benzoquinol methylase